MFQKTKESHRYWYGYSCLPAHALISFYSWFEAFPIPIFYSWFEAHYFQNKTDEKIMIIYRGISFLVLKFLDLNKKERRKKLPKVIRKIKDIKLVLTTSIYIGHVYKEKKNHKIFEQDVINLWASMKQQNWLQLLKILMPFYQPSLVILRGGSYTRELLLASKEHERKMTHPTYPTLNHTVYQSLMGCFSPFQNLLEKSRKNHVYTSLKGEWPEKKEV